MKKKIYTIFLIVIVILIINIKCVYGLVSKGLDIKWNAVNENAQTSDSVVKFMKEHYGYQDKNGKVQNPSVFITQLTYKTKLFGLLKYVQVGDGKGVDIRVSKKQLEQLGYTRRKNLECGFSCFCRSR